MKTIELTYGKVAVVDDADYYRLMRHRLWFAKRRKGQWFAARAVRDLKGDRHIFFMHEDILPAPDGHLTTHKDPFDTLNNRRSNLEVLKIVKAGRPKHMKGVSKNVGKFKAYASIKGKGVYIGSFLTAEGAAFAHDKAVFKAVGMKGLHRLNYPNMFKK
jgi:hypothetical protein